MPDGIDLKQIINGLMTIMTKGDDTLIICPKCGYAANVEKAECAPDLSTDKNGNTLQPTELPVEMVETPEVFSISDLERFFNESSKRFIKALIYRVINSALDLSDAKSGIRKNLHIGPFIDVSNNK